MLPRLWFHLHSARGAGAWRPAPELARLAEKAVTAALVEMDAKGEAELSLLFTDDAHIRRLNAEWRGKDRPTNVLSFPAAAPANGAALPPVLGDIVLAYETVAREAEDEKKPFEHHLSHLIVHGVAHLLGYDHEEEDEAEEMEALERAILARLAIPDPYV